MSEKADLKNHIASPPQTVHGIFSVTKTQIAVDIAAAVTAALSNLVHIQGAVMIANPFFQVGLANSSPVTFDHAFKAGTTPHVYGNSVLATEMASITGRSNTSFTFTVKYIDGTPGAGSLIWVAIGEKA
jgi:hypothetical protein